VDRVWASYAELLIAAAGSGLFDVLAHLDLPKKFGHRPTRPFSGAQGEVVAAVAASGSAVEISSGGRRKPVGEDYPAPGLLGALVSAGVPFALSSDAHAPSEVGYRFEDLVARARAAGIGRVAVFRRRVASFAAL
jgi:histidinol-phosphatase (PHP family)